MVSHEAGFPAMTPLTLSRHRHRALLGGLDGGTTLLAGSAHFSVYGLAAGQAQADPEDLLVVHSLAPEQIDNNVGAYVADELLPLLAQVRQAASIQPSLYASSEHETFQRCVGAIVRSMDGNERRAWHRFYDNTLAALRATGTTGMAPGRTDFIASFRAIYAKIAGLVAEVAAETVLDVATCFGFLPLVLAGQSGSDRSAGARRVTGCDINPALVALANDYRQQRQVSGVGFVCADILAARAVGDLDPGGGFDVVTAIHLLEHLTAAETGRAMRNLWALARRRLIVAVPFEDEPDRRYGHRQVFDEQSLCALGRRIEADCRFFAHHGGWVVLDRPASPQKHQREPVQ